MTLAWPNHLLTLDDWEALPEDELLRLELVEGVLAVVPQRSGTGSGSCRGGSSPCGSPRRRRGGAATPPIPNR